MRRWRGLDLIPMLLPPVTPRAATHTTNSERAVLAGNTVNDHEERREQALIIKHKFHSSCCVSKEFHFLYTTQIKPRLTSSPHSTWLCWNFAAGHPGALSVADWFARVGRCALRWLDKKEKKVLSYSIIHVKQLIFNGYFSVCEL